MYMYNVYVHCTYTYYNMYTEYIYVSFLQPHLTTIIEILCCIVVYI